MMTKPMPRIIAEGRYALVDLETTGLSTKRDEAVQIAFAIIDDGHPGLRGHYTTRPYVEITPGAQEKHGFDYTKIQASPSFSDIAIQLIEIIGNRTLLGFNVRHFDLKILQRQFAEHSPPLVFNPPVLDVLFWSRRLVPEIPHALGDMIRHFDIPPVDLHDAWRDVKATWGVFGRLAETYEAFGNLTPEEAIATELEKKKK